MVMFETRCKPRANVVAQLDAFGLDNVSFTARPLHSLASSSICVRIQAVSLNHRDLLIARGQFSPVAPLPLVLLSDCAGEVAAVGRDVGRFKIGDRVVGAPLPAWISGRFTSEMMDSALGVRTDGVLRQYFTGD